ncbi:hypothetical protein EON65_40390 [archaeon]|nr:MAG: hypothetical protein EON65_40390 [archaeon]
MLDSLLPSSTCVRSDLLELGARRLSESFGLSSEFLLLKRLGRACQGILNFFLDIYLYDE